MADSREGDQRPHRSLADKLNRLFETTRPADKGPWSNWEVERWLADRAVTDGDGLTISGNYLALLRNGQRDNPTMRNLQAIAKFFNIDPGYLLRDDEETEKTYADLELRAALDNANVRAIALRTHTLDPETQAWLVNTVMAMPPRPSPRRQRGNSDPADSPDH